MSTQLIENGMCSRCSVSKLLQRDGDKRSAKLSKRRRLNISEHMQKWSRGGKGNILSQGREAYPGK